MKKSFLQRKLRGITLLETLLSLAVGGIVIVSSVQGLSRYTEGVKVQATASLITRLNKAADLYAQDNFDNLIAAAPQELPITVLQPYFGSNIRQDAFRNTYVLSTRTYRYNTPDPVNGGTMRQDALQVLVVGRNPNTTLLDEKPALRSEVANATGADAGFISTMRGMCQNNAGNPMPRGSICGAFGSFSIRANRFPATDFSNAAVVSLVTKGDSSVYGDQLYRYDFGDPELNTMHTDLNMDSNEIINADVIRGNRLLEQEGARSRISNPGGEISVSAQGNVIIGSDTRTTIFNNNGNANDPRLVSNTGTLQLGRNANTARIGGPTSDTIPQLGLSAEIGRGDLLTGRILGDEVRVKEINSLHKVREDPLRLQQFARGEVIIGERARYTPAPGIGTASTNYELSDGQLTAGVIKTQDITCADCGGNLSQILPRWRHMGTYFIPSGPSVTVPKPQCDVARRDEINRPARGDERRVRNGGTDPRYDAKIILIPKHMVQDDDRDGRAGFDIEFFARDSGPSDWRIINNSEYSRVEAFAMTYCVFQGGPPDTLNPANPGRTVYTTRSATAGSGAWTRME